MDHFKKLKSGVIYTVGESEYIGAMPIRTDIEILPADDSSQKAIGWTVEILDGSEVYLESEPLKILESADSIKIGDKVIVTTLFGRSKMTVISVSGNEAMAETSGGSLAPLNFANDSRNCWTNSHVINASLLKNRSVKKDV